MPMRADAEPWTTPAIVLTLATVAVGLLVPPFLGMGDPSFRGALYQWLRLIFIYLAVFTFIAMTVTVSRDPGPLSGALGRSMPGWRARSLLDGWLLIALNFTAFGLIKPMLGVIGFQADPSLGEVDRMLLGADAWQVFEWVRHPFIGEAYHIVWLAWVFLAMALLLWQPPGVRKDRLLFAYFLLWLLGPLLHLLLPAAGPVLHEALTGSGVYEGLIVVEADAAKFRYLLEGYRTQSFSPAGGISAMPSLHVATMAWSVIAMRGPLRIIGVALTLYMWAASVALGWHYLVDGAAGIAVAIVALSLSRLVLEARRRFFGSSPALLDQNGGREQSA